MAELKLHHIYKRYGNVTAVGDFNIEVADGEFISFLGPSGCGKTTTLRMIAGFEKPTEGVITIGDQEIIVFKGNDHIVAFDMRRRRWEMFTVPLPYPTRLTWPWLMRLRIWLI